MHTIISYLKNNNLLCQANQTQSIDNRQRTRFRELDVALQGEFPEYGVIDVRSHIGIGEQRLCCYLEFLLGNNIGRRS